MLLLTRLHSACSFSQIPDFGGLWWLSYLATLMSFAYVSLTPAIHNCLPTFLVFLQRPANARSTQPCT